MNSGYILNELRLRGDSVDDAYVKFEPGLNTINGPSNTGKTFVFECINYMMGGSKPPKKIKQSRNYRSIFLEIVSHDSKVYTLESDFKGGDIKLYRTSISSITFDEESILLARKHNPSNENTVSAFFQKMNNVYGNEIRTNARGKKRQISYRDLVRFFLISEERIITKESLVFSHYTKATEEKNVLKFIVTGEDDSDIVALVTKDQISNKKGRLEFINETIADLEKSVGIYDAESVETKLTQIERQLEESKHFYSEISVELAYIRVERNEIANKIRKIELEKKKLEELYYRSSFLESQYNSDITRLDSTIEASSLLLDGDHESSKCPVCSSDLPKECSDRDIEQVITSCVAESDKILVLLKELNQSVSLIKNEISEKENILTTLYNDLSEFDKKIDSEFGGKLKSVLELIDQANDKKNSLLELKLKRKNIDKLLMQKEVLNQLIKDSKTKGEFDSISTANLTDLSKQIENVLRESNYPELVAVSFSEDKNDFVISGEDRELFGKGFRAIIYAAFIISIHELLINKPYSIGVPVIDSPLVTYKKPDFTEDDLIPVDLAQDFYRYLSTTAIKQTIIIENVPPPEDIISKMNRIVFTRSSSKGRYGFFPNLNAANTAPKPLS